MRAGLFGLALWVSLALLGACQRSVAAPASATGSRIVFEPAPPGFARQSDEQGCATPLMSSAGVYVLGGRREGERDASGLTWPSRRVTLHGPAPFSKELGNVVWLVGATHAARPELVLFGGYVRPFRELGPGAPQVGLFVMKLNVHGDVVFRRVAADGDPEAAAIAADSIALDADGRLLSLSPSPGIAALLGVDDGPGDYLTRGELGAAQSPLVRSRESETFEDFVPADAGTIFITARERGAEQARLLALEPKGRMAWQREVPYWTSALATDGAGGVWVTGSIQERDPDARTTQRSRARVLHYGPGGRLLGELTIGGARAPRPSAAATRSVEQAAVDARGRLWLLGHYDDSLAFGATQLSTERFEGQRFVAVLDAELKPLAALPIEREAELWRVGERVLVAHGEPGEECVVHALDVR